MENISSFILPDLKKPEKPKKEPKKIIDKKERLVRINREVKCAYCSELKTLNPDQYQLLFDMYGSEERVSAEYKCKPCQMKERANPVTFGLKHGELLHDLAKDLKEVFDLFNASFKTQQDFQTLNSLVVDKLGKLHIKSFVILLSRDNHAKGVQLKDFPFVGTINLKIYENRNERIQIV